MKESASRPVTQYGTKLHQLCIRPEKVKRPNETPIDFPPANITSDSKETEVEIK